jgi:CHAD domain-containing protein
MRRILLEQVEKACKALEGDEPLDDEAVHGIRKRMKRARAAVRLVRKALGSKLYRRENAALRDASRPLTDVRDARILIETFDRLREGVEPRIGIAFQRVHDALVAQQSVVWQRLFSEPDMRRDLRRHLEKIAERAEDWPLERAGWSVLGSGLKRVYRSGRNAMVAVGQDRSVANLHEWRKQTKYLRYQLEFLEPVWPVAFADLADDADQLGVALGDDHDLAVLRETIERMDATVIDATARSHLYEVIDARRDDLQSQATDRGRRLYSERPSEFVARFALCWHSWRADKPAKAG